MEFMFCQNSVVQCGYGMQYGIPYSKESHQVSHEWKGRWPSPSISMVNWMFWCLSLRWSIESLSLSGSQGPEEHFYVVAMFVFCILQNISPPKVVCFFKIYIAMHNFRPYMLLLSLLKFAYLPCFITDFRKLRSTDIKLSIISRQH
jgi:hypothetical protein